MEMILLDWTRMGKSYCLAGAVLEGGSFAADLWIADLAAKTYTKLLPDERYNRYWPMWGADNAIYYVGDPLPNDKTVRPGSPEVRKSTNNIYKIPASGSGQPTRPAPRSPRTPSSPGRSRSSSRPRT